MKYFDLRINKMIFVSRKYQKVNIRNKYNYNNQIKYDKHDKTKKRI